MSTPPIDHPALASRFLPSGAVTGIGSLPFATADDAVAFVAAYSPVVPFAPQPPVDGGMDGLAREQLRLMTHRDGRHRDWFDRFHAAVIGGRFPKARAVKVQVAGPLTLAKLCTHNGRPADQEAEALALLRREVIELAVWQLRRLRPAGLPVLVVFDEPLLGALDAEDRACALRFLDDALAAVRASGGLAGLHCCANLGPAAIGESSADVISFAAAGSLADADREAIAASDWTAAFGLLSTDTTARGAERALNSWLQVALVADGAVALARRTLVTPTCGLGRATPAAAERVFGQAAVVAAAIERIAWKPSCSPGEAAPTMQARPR